MKTKLLLQFRNLWAVPTLFAAAIGLRAALLADPVHPAPPDPAPKAAAKPAPVALSPDPVFERVKELRAKADKSEPMDEALSGRTMKGTPVTPRTPECFPAESRDLFWQMDMVATDKDGPLHPLNFDTNADGKIDNAERNAIRGRNTWLLWGAGNETFWNWLAQDGFGITDFLVMLDARRRGDRFVRAGLINQPGFKVNASKRTLGLYLDAPIEDAKADYKPDDKTPPHMLTPPPWDTDAKTYGLPADHAGFELFERGDDALGRQFYAEAMDAMNRRRDGVDYSVYGYPTGIFGMRMFLNPDFFGKGEYPAKARAYWKKQVVDRNDGYYTDATITKDPKLVRPFRISVSCGFCHIGPHPLNPPKDPEAPAWENLSSLIGAQYWKPQPAFGNLQTGNSLLFHFLASQQPGTVDTSLVSTDHINNANTMNAVWDINARLGRAVLNPSERQSASNVLVPSIEDAGLPVKGDGKDWRHTPRVLVDGSDSIGAFGALARVYLNIGTFYEEWSTCHNPLIGYRPQRPFGLAICQRNSVYWQVNEKYRTPYLAAFFTFKNLGRSTEASVAGDGALKRAILPHTSTPPMKLATAKDPDGTPSKAAAKMLALDTATQRKHGREVWLDHCAICHSSKQPEGFALNFERKKDGATWDKQAAPKDHHYILPMDSSEWLAFKRSEAYGEYKMSLRLLVDQEGRPKPGDPEGTPAITLNDDPIEKDHPFWKDNFLSAEIRVPVTLVGTNSGRAMATNGLAHNVWDNFTSETYKELPAVGNITYFNPIAGKEMTYAAAAGGRGYYRPATNIGLWATAPFLHNNSMGIYLDDPSVKGRLVQFADGMRRMLWKDRRASRSLILSDKELAWLNEVQAGDASKIDPAIVVTRPGDLRGGLSSSAAGDAGFIYRLPQEANVEFPAVFARPLIQGIAGKAVISFLALWLWVILGVLYLLLAWKRKPRYLGIVLLLLAVLIAVGIALTGLGGGGSTVGALLMAASGLLEFSSWQWWAFAIALGVYGVIFIQARPDCEKTARLLLGLLLLGAVFAVMRISKSVPVTIIALFIGWMIWRRSHPTLAGFSRGFFLALTVITIGIGYLANCFINGRAIVTIPFANIKIGPLDIKAGPIPRGTPINLMMNMDPASKNAPKALVSLVLAMADIKKQGLTGDKAWDVFKSKAGQSLMDASKCPDFVLDRGHLFGETLDPDPVKNDQAKEDLIAFLKTL
ncbi:MAG: hypothetical protein ABIP20_13935 [Chthoniobacteraceae bacterium]